MKEKIRNLKLHQLSDTSLPIELEELNNAIIFIQSLLNKVVIKKDIFKYPNRVFFILNDVICFDFNDKTTYLWCRYDNFWELLSEKYNHQEVKELIKLVFEEHFRNIKVIPTFTTTKNRNIEEYFFKNLEITPYFDTNKRELNYAVDLMKS